MRSLKSPLLKRLKSLEDYLGVLFSDEDDYPDHEEKKYAKLTKIEDRLDRIEKKVFTEKERKQFGSRHYFD